MLLVLLVRAQLQISEKPTNEIGKCGFWWQRPEKLDYFCSQIAPSQHLVLLQILYFFREKKYICPQITDCQCLLMLQIWYL